MTEQDRDSLVHTLLILDSRKRTVWNQLLETPNDLSIQRRHLALQEAIVTLRLEFQP